MKKQGGKREARIEIQNKTPRRSGHFQSEEQLKNKNKTSEKNYVLLSNVGHNHVDFRFFVQFFLFFTFFPTENGSILSQNVRVWVLGWVFLALFPFFLPLFFHVVIVTGCCNNVSMI